FGGAEIKTEGDSFYVVFSSVSSAVRCGLALTADAKQASAEHPEQRVRVGVGIPAGECLEAAARRGWRRHPCRRDRRGGGWLRRLAGEHRGTDLRPGWRGRGLGQRDGAR